MRLSRQLFIGIVALSLQLPGASAQQPEATAAPDAGVLPIPVDPPPGTDALQQVVAPSQLPSSLAPDMLQPVIAMPQQAELANACCPVSCDPCCTQGGGVLAGAGMYIIQPYFNNNMAFGLQTTTGRVQPDPNVPAAVPGARTNTRVEIAQHMEVAPQLWLGYLTDSGFGGRIRWWYFRQGTQQAATGTVTDVDKMGNPVNGTVIASGTPLGMGLINGVLGTNTMVATSKLQLQVWDFDTLYHLPGCKWDLLFAGGLRLASLDQTYNAYTAGQSLLSSNVFSGIGPTLGLEARRKVGCSGFNLYGAARGSILFGGANQLVAVLGIPEAQAAQEHRDIGMPVAEGELGLEYGRNMGGSRLFGQIAIVGQEWFGAGGASRSTTSSLPGASFGTSHAVDSDLAFFGLLLRAGVNY